MDRNAQRVADRLRTALRFHTNQPRHRGSVLRVDDDARPVADAGASPGEEFARRLRAAIDA